ncbi:acyl-CoA thioesterase [Ornithinimicrobium faecis]|uniref:acyl-CoA thioesterase n=1 Tax=Ornithinimicrobium faecis TaxID=2934158 RepID=UPI002FC9BB1D
MDISSVIRDLELEVRGGDCFQGWAPRPHPSSTRAFGGHLLAQGLRAATLTLPEGRLPQSLHAYFVRPVAVDEDIDYAVTRHLDGGAFSMRRVVATQGEDVVLELQTTAGPPWEPTGELRTMEGIPDPESLPSVQEQLARYANEQEGWWTRPRPFDLRYATLSPREALDADQAPPARSGAWFRWNGEVDMDPALQRCLLVYLSDMTVLDPVVLSRWGKVRPGSQHLTSLDHSVWFHGEPDLNQWLLFEKDSPGGTARTGLSIGTFCQLDGTVVASVAQEGLIRSSALTPSTQGRDAASDTAG